MVVVDASQFGVGHFIYLEQVAEPLLRGLRFPQIGKQIRQIALPDDDAVGDRTSNTLRHRFALNRPGQTGGGSNRSKELGVRTRKALGRHGAGGLSGAINAGKVQVGVFAVNLLPENGNQRVIEQVRVRMGDAGRAGAVCLADKGQGHTLLLGYLPPKSRVHKDGIGL